MTERDLQIDGAMQYAPVLVVALLSATASAQAIPQATLTALAPITITGSVGPPVSHPAGPLTSMFLSYGPPAGVHYGTYQCAVTNGIGGCSMTAELMTGWGSQGWLTADLLLVVSTPAPGPVAHRLEMWHHGDSALSTGFQIDYGNDGSVEATTWTLNTSSTEWRWSRTLDFATGTLPIRIRSNSPIVTPPQTYSLSLEFVPWAPCATPVAEACPSGAVYGPSPGASFYTNSQLAALPAPAPARCELRAVGLGRFAAFVASDQPLTFPFMPPSPFLPVLCDVLTNVLAAVPGTASGAVGLSTNPQFTDWSLTLPQLPSGLVLYVQHVSAMLGAGSGSAASVGVSNVLRIDT